MYNEDLNYRFGDFLLDTSNRQLWRGDTRIDLNARYFDALVLLVRERGQLIEKDRFFTEVWNDVVVSDSALTQCIKDVRKHLGDDASNPHYIQTVPRHGYRFIGHVETVPSSEPAGAEPSQGGSVVPKAGIDDSKVVGVLEKFSLLVFARWVIAGTLGGGFAGVLGGLLYGWGLTFTPADPGMGTVSILAVLLSVNILVGSVGGFGVSLGLGAVGLVTHRHSLWGIVGAAFGGLVVGGMTKILGMDAFTLFFGTAPTGITGGMEGALLGASLALGAWLGGGFNAASPWHPVVGAGISCAAAGALIPIIGGHLMGGSLELLARSFSGSQLQLDALGRFFGEVHFSNSTQVVLGSIEGLLFGSCVVTAIILVHRMQPNSSSTG